jgi:acetoin utilization deacetylase AcuC-like enzyme
MSTALLYDPLFLQHRTGWQHPEKPQRLTAILERLQAAGQWDRLVRPVARDASPEDLAAIHDPAYVDRLAAQCAAGRVFEAAPETLASSATHAAACRAAGAVVTAIDTVFDGRATNAFCAVRPPGHHAESDHPMGFCFFNNVAIGARYAQRHRGVRRVAIIDWDLHHGNGIQHAFDSDPTVFYISLHEYPLYPHSGRRQETGQGAGRGFTLNIPMAAGATDADYHRAFREEIRPALNTFRPEFILIAAGFDAHRDDPMGGLLLTEDGFADMTRQVCALAAAHAGRRVVSVLEGGYQPGALAASVSAHVGVLMEAGEDASDRAGGSGR